MMVSTFRKIVKSILFVAFAAIFLVGFQTAEAQHIRQNFGVNEEIVFFKSNDNLVYKIIKRLYAPKDEVVRYTQSRIDSCFLLTISCENGIINARLHLGDDYFDNIEIFPALDWVTPYVEKNVLKAFADEMVKKYNADAIAWIEKKMGKRVHAMNTKELCLSAITLHYYTYDDVTLMRYL